jgi:hypothetical protein
MNKLLPTSILGLCAVMLLNGCVHHPNLNISSSTPSYIEVNGEIVCDKTPCITPAPIHSAGFICDDINYRSSIVMAIPIDKSKGVTQQKAISARCNDRDKLIYFDMLSMGGLQTTPFNPPK